MKYIKIGNYDIFLLAYLTMPLTMKRSIKYLNKLILTQLDGRIDLKLVLY